jgi:hypothetical protein
MQKIKKKERTIFNAGGGGGMPVADDDRPAERNGVFRHDALEAGMYPGCSPR